MQRGPRKMFDVRHLGLTCADCGAPIEELPFMPKTDRPVYCPKCARNHRRQNPRILRQQEKKWGGRNRPVFSPPPPNALGEALSPADQIQRSF